MGKEINRRKDCRLRQRYRLIRNDKDINLGEGWVMAKNEMLDKETIQGTKHKTKIDKT